MPRGASVMNGSVAESVDALDSIRRCGFDSHRPYHHDERYTLQAAPAPALGLAHNCFRHAGKMCTQ